MKKTGELLKKVREEKGLSLYEIGLSLKINPKILKQIEDGDMNNLPAKTFLRGFVQSYANHLKIDTDEILNIFMEEMGTTKPQQISFNTTPDLKTNEITIAEKIQDQTKPEKEAEKSFSSSKMELKNFGVGLLVFLLLISLIGVRKIVEKYQREAEVDPILTTDNKTNSNNTLPLNPILNKEDVDLDTQDDNPIIPTTTKKSPTENTKPTSQNSHPTADSQKVTRLSTTNSLASPPTKPSVNQQTNPPVNPSSTGTNDQEHTKPSQPEVVKKIEKKVETPVKTEETKPIASKPEVKNIELVIEALDSVEIEIIQVNGKVEKLKLAPSETQKIKTVGGVKLNISNGGAINLTLNGKDIGIPGDLGKPKRISF